MRHGRDELFAQVRRVDKGEATMSEVEEVIVYSTGLCYCSVCAPKHLPVVNVETAVDLSNPTGLDHGWRKSPEDFINGASNPCQCETDPNRLHYLLVC